MGRKDKDYAYFWLDKKLLEQLRELKAKTGVPMSRLVEKALKNWLETEGRELVKLVGEGEEE